MSLELMSVSESLRLKNVFNFAITDYFNSKVYCLGFFRYPTDEEIKSHSKTPFAIFEPAESHGWKVTFYSINEVVSAIQNNCKQI